MTRHGRPVLLVMIEFHQQAKPGSHRDSVS